MMLLAFLLAALAWLKIVTVWEVVLIAFLNGTAMAMNAPSYQALVPRLVPREDLTNAIALNSAQFNMSRILGPTLGGYAMAAFGVAGNFLLNGFSFLAVLFALVSHPLSRGEQDSRRESMFTSFRAWRRAQPAADVCFGVDDRRGKPPRHSHPHLHPLFRALRILQVGESGLGPLLACSGAGAVLGAFTVAWQGQIRHRGAVIAFAGAAVMATVVVFCYSRNFLLSEFLMLIEGYGNDPHHFLGQRRHATPLQRRDARARHEHLWHVRF